MKNKIRNILLIMLAIIIFIHLIETTYYLIKFYNKQQELEKRIRYIEVIGDYYD